jgi:hypothetical protein
MTILLLYRKTEIFEMPKNKDRILFLNNFRKHLVWRNIVNF